MRRQYRHVALRIALGRIARRTGQRIGKPGDGGTRRHLLLRLILFLQRGDGVAQDGWVGLQRHPHHVDDFRPLLGGEAIGLRRHPRHAQQDRRQQADGPARNHSTHQNPFRFSSFVVSPPAANPAAGRHQ
jgi:hypothetical protein